MTWKIAVLCLMLWSPTWAYADTLLEWDRNTDDTVKYNVYVCSVKNCVVSTASLKSADIPQTAVGVVPNFTLPLNTEGTVAVTATDAANNESGLSVFIPFDKKAPIIPTNPRSR